MTEKLQQTGKLNLSALKPELIRVLSALQVQDCQGCQSCQGCQGCQSCQSSASSVREQNARAVIYEMIQESLTENALA